MESLRVLEVEVNGDNLVVVSYLDKKKYTGQDLTGAIIQSGSGKSLRQSLCLTHLDDYLEILFYKNGKLALGDRDIKRTGDGWNIIFNQDREVHRPEARRAYKERLDEVGIVNKR